MLEFASQGLPLEAGATAPTVERLEPLIQGLVQSMPKDWYTYSAHKKLFSFAWGFRLRLVAAKPYSAAVGNPIQGWDWCCSASEEQQNAITAENDIEARGRRAPDGVYRRFVNATIPETEEWEHFLEEKQSMPDLWHLAKLRGPDNAFTHPDYWVKLQRTMGVRTYARLVEGRYDLPSDDARFPSFTEEYNTGPVPRVGARDVTQSIVGEAALLGHDPGASVAVSYVIKVYQVREGEETFDRYYVVDEIVSDRRTEAQHIRAVTEQLQKYHNMQWGDIDSPQVFGRCDPYGDSDNKTDITVYTQWRAAGYRMEPAAYSKKNPSRPGRVPREEAYEMLDTLFCDTAGRRRLVIATNELGKSCAPKLLHACKRLKRMTKAQENAHKGKPSDLTHYPAALKYALWLLEKPRALSGVRTGGIVY
jgi:hypothetical protein